MADVLNKFKLHFERLEGYTGGIKNKVIRKIKPQKHPFLKGHKLDEGWAEKLTKDSKKVGGAKKAQRRVVEKGSKKVVQPRRKVSR